MGDAIPEESGEGAGHGETRDFRGGQVSGGGKKPVSIVAAMEEVAEEGTGSLLDIMRVSKIPELCSVCSVSAKERKDFFGTEHPDGSEIAGAMAFWESFDRGMARAVTLYEQGAGEFGFLPK